jgi:hypothetical protein
LEGAHDAAFEVEVLGRDLADFLAVIDPREQLGGLADLLGALFGFFDGLFALLAVLGLFCALERLDALLVFRLQSALAAALALLVLLALLFFALLGVCDVAPGLGLVSAVVFVLASGGARVEDFQESARAVEPAALSS